MKVLCLINPDIGELAHNDDGNCHSPNHDVVLKASSRTTDTMFRDTHVILDVIKTFPRACLFVHIYGKEASFFMKRLAKQLAHKWNRPYSSTISLLRTRFAISLVRSKNRCLRGARISPYEISYL